jgi:hypothetical protein
VPLRIDTGRHQNVPLFVPSIRKPRLKTNQTQINQANQKLITDVLPDTKDA